MKFQRYESLFINKGVFLYEIPGFTQVIHGRLYDPDHQLRYCRKTYSSTNIESADFISQFKNLKRVVVVVLVVVVIIIYR